MGENRHLRKQSGNHWGKKDQTGKRGETARLPGKWAQPTLTVKEKSRKQWGEGRGKEGGAIRAGGGGKGSKKVKRFRRWGKVS